MEFKYIKQAKAIVKEFIDEGLPQDANIPNNRIFVTDITASTLARVRKNVVIEHYFMFPNIMDAAMHTHPFANQVLFVCGDLTGYQTVGDRVIELNLSDQHQGFLSPVSLPPYKHGFKTGDKGAIMYNIQIWNCDVVNPTSASVIYDGHPLGPMHATFLTKST